MSVSKEKRTKDKNKLASNVDPNIFGNRLPNTTSYVMLMLMHLTKADLCSNNI